ncbi:MAG TPA: hypothetical protein VKB26_01175, partial [Candidatus Acidoferrales bacterium]|nr:hypothetical protein [Candidatus Acidoferrales bacterium]
LMLRDDIVDAVAKGKFHIFPVATIDQGIEILTGVKAGCRDGSGKFELGSIFARADDRLRLMARTLSDYE